MLRKTELQPGDLFDRFISYVNPGEQSLGEQVNENFLTEVARRSLEAGCPEPQGEPNKGLQLIEYRPEGEEWVTRYTEVTAAQAQYWVQSELHKSAQDPAYFATNFCVSENAYLDAYGTNMPRAEIMPDLPWVGPVLRTIADGHDVHIEKSRDMMMSWLSMASIVHDLIFRRNWSIMTVSRVEMLVDDGGEGSTQDSLHGKVRYIYNHLPGWLQKAAPFRFKYLQIHCATTRSHVQGFSATPSAGRGPKWKRAICDEFAWVPKSEMVMTSITRACPTGKILVSTPNGKANAFYRIRGIAQPYFPKTDKENPKKWKLLTVHWSQHPDRGDKWYQDQINSGSMTAEAVAQELDISYERSVAGRVYPKFVYEKHVGGGILCDVPTVYDPDRPLLICMDFNHDPLVWVIAQTWPGEQPFRVIDEICKRNAVYSDGVREFFVRYGSKGRVDFHMQRFGDWREHYAEGGICLAGSEGHQEVHIYGDATEEKSTVYSRVKMYGMIRQQLLDFGFTVKMFVPKSNPPIMQRVEIVNDALGKDLIVVDPKAEELIKDLEGGVWDSSQKDMDQNKKDQDGSGLTRSHASSAFGYMLHRKHKVKSSVDKPMKKSYQQDIRKLLPKW